MERGHAHEEDGRARRVDVVVHPVRPRREHLPVRLDPHHLVMLLPALGARSPASMHVNDQVPFRERARVKRGGGRVRRRRRT